MQDLVGVAQLTLDDAPQQEFILEQPLACWILRRTSQAALTVTPSWRESSAAEGALSEEADSQIARSHLRTSVRVQERQDDQRTGLAVPVGAKEDLLATTGTWSASMLSL